METLEAWENPGMKKNNLNSKGIILIFSKKKKKAKILKPYLPSFDSCVSEWFSNKGLDPSGSLTDCFFALIP